MTTTTPTPALADLDNTAKEALRDLSHIENHLQESSAPTTVMNRALDVRMGIKELRAALARRAAQLNSPEFGGIAAQPVAPVQADAQSVDDIVTALYRRFKDWSKRGFGPDDVTWCEVKADVISLIGLATPSPQIAEVAELERIHAFLLGEKPINGLWFGDLPGVGHEGGKFWWRMQLRDAIAASRRAAGGEVVDALKAIRDLAAFDPNGAAYYRKAENALAAIECRDATPAPASAGQAEPRELTDPEIVEVLASLGTDAEPSKYDWNPVLQVRTTVPAIRQIVAAYLKYAAQPAEGAGQAGQVAMTERTSAGMNSGELVDAFTTAAPDFARERMVALRRDGEGWRPCGRGHRDAMYCASDVHAAVIDMLATERAAAPAEQASAQVKP